MNVVMSRQILFSVLRRVAAAGLALFLTGCGGFTTIAPARAPAQPANQRPEPSLSELEAVTAKVVSLNSEQDFVVMEFTSRVLPAVGTRVTIYRNGKPVGAVRITEPARAPLATADIVEGEVRVGDEAH